MPANLRIFVRHCCSPLHWRLRCYGKHHVVEHSDRSYGKTSHLTLNTRFRSCATQSGGPGQAEQLPSSLQLTLVPGGVGAPFGRRVASAACRCAHLTARRSDPLPLLQHAPSNKPLSYPTVSLRLSSNPPAGLVLCINSPSPPSFDHYTPSRPLLDTMLATLSPFPVGPTLPSPTSEHMPMSSALLPNYASVLSYASLAPPSARLSTPPSPLIDGQYFPHIVDTVVELAP